MADKSAARNEPVISEEAMAGNALLQRVTKTLLETNPADWQQAGKPLNPDARFPAPRSVHERVLVLAIPNASLVLRSSQPVGSLYLPGGYTLTPTGPCNYFIEVRDRIFDAEKLVDPKYADNWKGKRCDPVARGQVAKDLFDHVLGMVTEYREERQKHFDQKVTELVHELPELVEKTPVDNWEKKEEADEIPRTTYSAEFEGINVSLSKELKDGEHRYSIVFSQGDLLCDDRSARLAKSLLNTIEEMSQNADLIALNSVLEEFGL